jgi:Rrf2 family iron-sulfur cluster assembly transcriptional regulator
MILSKPCEYAIRAVTRLAAAPLHTLSGEEIARADHIPLPILSKVLQDLVRQGLLKSRRGPGGGFRLARRPEFITLRDVVAAMDGLDHFYQCVSGLPDCSEEAPCPLHDMWRKLRENLMASLDTTNFEDMARAAANKTHLAAIRRRRSRLRRS